MALMYIISDHLRQKGVTTVKVADDEEGHKKMEEMLANGEVDGAVTMHFPFPIGVSTVGRVVTPAKGKGDVCSKYNRNIQCRSYRRYDQEHDLRNHCSKNHVELLIQQSES